MGYFRPCAGPSRRFLYRAITARMIDPDREELLSLAEAAKLPAFRGDGRPSHVGTVGRGVWRGFNGVRLEGVRRGREPVTTAAACARFMRALADRAKVAPAASPAARSAIPRARVSRLLDDAGF